MPNLDVKVSNYLLCQTSENVGDTLTPPSNYQNHVSIKSIFKKMNFQFSFSSKTVSITYIEKEIKSLDTTKAPNSLDIP